MSERSDGDERAVPQRPGADHGRYATPCCRDADVLVVGDRIAEVGVGLTAPEGTVEIDASRRHPDARHDRHPPAHVADRDARLRRRLDPDPVLRLVLPRVRQAVPARGHLRRQPARRDRGDRRRRHHHRRLVARPADRRSTPTPRSTPWRRCRAGSCSPTATSSRARGSGRPAPAFRDFVNRRLHGKGDMLGFQMAFDVTGDPAFPEKAAFEVARELGVPVTTHAGVWGATNDDGIRLMHENGFMTPQTIYVHAATLTHDSYHRIAATGGSVSVATESEQSAGQGYPPTWQLRAPRHPGLAVDGHQRLVERRPVLRDAHHARRRPVPGAHGGARQRRDGHPLPPAGRAGRRLGHPGRQPGARARLGRRQPGGRARRPTSC